MLPLLFALAFVDTPAAPSVRPAIVVQAPQRAVYAPQAAANGALGSQDGKPITTPNRAVRLGTPNTVGYSQTGEVELNADWGDPYHQGLLAQVCIIRPWTCANDQAPAGAGAVVYLGSAPG